MKIVQSRVIGVAPKDRNVIGGMIQRYLQEHEKIDLRIDWVGGEGETTGFCIAFDCSEFDFARLDRGATNALKDTCWSCGLSVEPLPHLLPS